MNAKQIEDADASKLKEESGDRITCPLCGMEMSSDSMFCLNCGLELESEEARKIKSKPQNKCPHCEKERRPEERFCTKCGKRFVRVDVIIENADEECDEKVRKILKYLIGLLLCGSLLVTFIPFMEVQETDISMMDLFRAFAASGNGNSAAEYIVEETKGIFAGPFVMELVIFMTVLICAVYVFASGWKSSYVISLSGAVIVSGEAAFLVWRIYTDIYTVIKKSETLSLIFNDIHIKMLPLFIWCIIYVLIIIGSIWGITYKPGMTSRAVRSELNSGMTDSFDDDRNRISEMPARNEGKSFDNEELTSEEDLSEDDIMTEIAGVDMESDKIHRCPQCGSEADEETVFCGWCGFKLK